MLGRHDAIVERQPLDLGQHIHAIPAGNQIRHRRYAVGERHLVLGLGTGEYCNVSVTVAADQPVIADAALEPIIAVAAIECVVARTTP